MKKHRKPYFTSTSDDLSTEHHRSAIVQAKDDETPSAFTFTSVQSNLDLDTQLKLGHMRSRLPVS